MLTALAFGSAPAMHAATGTLSAALKEGGRGDTNGRSRNRLRSVLVASEFALASMLLIGAGLTNLLSQIIAKMLFGVQPYDAVTFLSVTFILGLAAVLAAAVPARQAIQTEPMIALRNE